MDASTKRKIKDSFLRGALKVTALQEGERAPGQLVVKDVMRHRTPHKPVFRIRTDLGQEVVCTGDHSLFRWGPDGAPVPFPAEEAVPGVTALVSLDQEGGLARALVSEVQQLPPEPFTFDLCVPGAENFFLANGLLAHNSYSIGGISLDISKASQYESLKGNAESQLDKLAEFKTRTEKYTFGLQQPRMGVGVRSSFGPSTGRSTITPRKYLGF